MTSPKQVECIGGPLDGEFRPQPAVRLKEVCEYAADHPEHLFPRAVYNFITHRRWGVILEFQGMEP